MSPVPAPSVRRSRRAVAALAVAAVALLGACTHQRTTPDKYGDTTRENFTEGCVEALTQRGADSDGVPESDLGGSEPFSAERARAVCGCSYEDISGQGGIPFERFKQINEELEEEPGPLPDEILTIVSTCVEENPA